MAQQPQQQPATPRAPPTSNVVVTIPAGQSLSNPANCSGYQIVAILVPDDWTDARLSVQVSTNNNQFYDLYNPDNTEVAINVTAGTMVQLQNPLSKFPSNTAMWVRLRSGVRAQGKPQKVSVDLTLLLI